MVQNKKQKEWPNWDKKMRKMDQKSGIQFITDEIKRKKGKNAENDH